MGDAKAWKVIALTFAGKLITAGWSAVKACALVGVHRTSWYRHLSPSSPAGILVPHADRAYPNRITDAEADAFMELLKLQGVRQPFRHPVLLSDAGRGALLLLHRRRPPHRGTERAER